MAELKQRRLGRTDLMVTELGVGTLDTAQSQEGQETLQRALDLGINFIDTARIYDGAEYLIGQVIRARGEKTFYVGSKTVNRTRDGAQYDIDRSLRLLGVEKIDLYQLDDVSPDDWETAMHEEDGALAGLKIAQYLGKIDHIGMSSHHLDIVERAITSGEFETVMLEYSAFAPESARLISLAHDLDLGVLTMRPLGGSGRMTTIRGQLREAPASTLSPATLLRYVLSHPGVSVAIPGVRYPSRVEENVELARSYQPMSEAEKQECEEQARRLGI